jgi:hypothetical protein
VVPPAGAGLEEASEFGAVEEPPAGAELEAPPEAEDGAPPGADGVPVLGAAVVVEAGPEAAGFGEFEAQPVAATATRAPPASRAMLFSRFMPG